MSFAGSTPLSSSCANERAQELALVCGPCAPYDVRVVVLPLMSLSPTPPNTRVRVLTSYGCHQRTRDHATGTWLDV